MIIRHVVSCRGWSSDAYWAARMVSELERAGHRATLVHRAGAEAVVGRRARGEGVTRLDTLRLAPGLDPVVDARDVRRLIGWLASSDVVHVHRGKEHWLAALANRLCPTPRPLFRTRHIVLPIRPHALNRWLYGRATDRVITVTEAIRRQCVAAGVVGAQRVVALPGGVDADRFVPRAGGVVRRAASSAPDGTPVIGLVAGLRAMKGHHIAIEAAATLARQGLRTRLVLIGKGGLEPVIREAVARTGLASSVSLAGHVEDVAAAMATLDVGLYVPLESDGMSRVLFEYLAMGLPVIASRVGVVPEVLRDEVHALLVPGGDAACLAAALRRLLDDEALRTRLGQAARALIETRLAGARVASRLASLYRVAVGDRERGAP